MILMYVNEYGYILFIYFVLDFIIIKYFPSI